MNFSILDVSTSQHDYKPTIFNFLFYFQKIKDSRSDSDLTESEDT